MPKNPFPTSLEKILGLLELFLAQPDGFTPQELLARSELSRSSLYTLLAELKDLGYLEQNERRGKYHCGPRLQAWRAYAGDFRQELIASFNQETGNLANTETLLLAVPLKDEIQVLQQAEGISVIRSVYKIGETYASLAAAAYLFAAQPLESVRTHGYSLVTEADEIQLALPICPDGSSPQAAILLTAPAYRWEAAHFTAVHLDGLRQIAAHLSYRLGALAYTPYHQNSQQEYPEKVELSEADIRAFLREPYTARLACVRPDGLPHVIPVWQAWDGEGFVVVAWEGSVWANYIRSNPNVSLTIDEPWPPLRRLTARGSAQPLPYAAGSPELGEIAARLSQRYLGGSFTSIQQSRITDAFRIEIQSLRGWQGLPSAAAAPIEPSHEN